jgi:hypothetical protein
MSRLSIGEKAERLLKLLGGLRDARVQDVLAAYGFTEADYDEGWELLRGVVGARLKALPTPVKNREDLTRLDQLENRWFPIASATLARRFPAIHERVFRNLTQTEGEEVILSMGTFVSRVEELEGANAPAEAKAARELLTKRGLTPAVIAEAKELLTRLQKIQPAPVVDETALAAARDEAVTKMWNYYLEWSEIVRSTVSGRTLLRQLGFLQTPARPDDEPVPPAPAK